MNFRTRLDITNRQAKQNEKTQVTLSGASSFGVPYSALTTGPDLSITGITFNDSGLESTFSGNTGTTVYTFGDSRMTTNESELVPITPSNSATTQNTGPIWVGYDMFTTVDGYTGWTSYSAVTYPVQPYDMVDLGGGAYSGSFLSDFTAYSASSVDFTGSTTWVDVSGITRTADLVVTNGAVAGYVLTAEDSTGKIVYMPVSAATSGATFWIETGSGNTALKDDKGGHTIAGVTDKTLVAGGYTHYVEASLGAFIGGGSGHSVNATSHFAGVVGGKEATITGGRYSIIAGGSGHTISTNHSFIGGGIGHSIGGGVESAILGGRYATIGSSIDSSIIGGSGNTMGGDVLSSGIFAGIGNTISSATTSTVVGGSGNTIDLVGPNTYGPKHAGIFAGADNRITVKASFTANDFLSANHSVIVGGNSNLISGHTNSFIGGGELNMIECDQGWNSVVGGYNNKNTAAYSTIIGGQNNQLGTNCGDGMSIMGGINNLIELNNYSSIIGGEGNSLLGGSGDERNTILGGSGNTLDSVINSAIIGGSGISGTSDNTVYVPNLNIGTVGGGTSANSIGLDTNGNVITGVTKEFFVNSIGLNPAIIGSYYAMTCNGGTDPVYVNGNFPDDMDSLISVDLLSIPAFTNSATTMDLDAQYGPIGTDYSAGTYTWVGQDWDFTQDEMSSNSVLPLFSAATANDMFGFEVFQNNSNLYVIGLKIKYKAN